MSSYKSRKPPPKQKLISSFFLPVSTPISHSGPIVSRPGKSDKTTAAEAVLRTPEKVVKAPRTLNSHLQKLSAHTAFDEPASSDTSFVSPEVDNFRNPILKSLTGKSTGLPTKPSTLGTDQEIFVVSDDETDKENKRPSTQEANTSLVKPVPALKRAATSNLLDFLSGKPKKVRKAPATTSPQPLPSDPQDVHLSEAQLAIIDAVKRGDNVFFTGSAGTGKSVVLRELVKELYRIHGVNRVGVTASTGLAACNIKGQTLHKYLGIGIGTGKALDISKRIKKNPTSFKTWKSMRVLLIDEILMIDGKLFTKIDEIAKIMKNNSSPFGGVQLVCCGDFYQLPPVNKEGGSQYCFNSPAWKSAMKQTMVLTKVFRQEGDNQLIDMLNALREGTFSQELLHLFHQLKRKVQYTDGIEPTELFPTRNEVKQANDIRLQNLKSDAFTYTAIDNDDSPYLRKQFDNLMCEEKLTLKVGAQVMYLKNHPGNIVVNGSIGKVIGFLPEEIFARMFLAFHAEDFVNVLDQFIQMIEFLCSAVGTKVLPDILKSIFDSFPLTWKQILGPLVREASITSKALSLPVVNFKSNDLSTVIQVKREEFTVDGNKKISFQGSTPKSLIREQIPLVLAWAMSIHKSQGQSIDRLRVDLRRTFEKGQIYVALSRATNKDHLEVYNFDHRRISVSEEVRDFYRSLKAAGE